MTEGGILVKGSVVGPDRLIAQLLDPSSAFLLIQSLCNGMVGDPGFFSDFPGSQGLVKKPGKLLDQIGSIHGLARSSLGVQIQHPLLVDPGLELSADQGLLCGRQRRRMPDVKMQHHARIHLVDVLPSGATTA